MIEGAAGQFYLVGRYRNVGDSRTGLGAGERGLELAIFRSDDRGTSWQEYLRFSKSDLNAGYRSVLSIEGSALHLTEKGVELFVSTEKEGIQYPAEFRDFLKPGTGVWTIDRLHVDPRDPRLLFAFGDRDFLRSDDGGSTWESLPLSDIRGGGAGAPDLAAGGADGQTCYAVVPNDGGLYRSQDAGRSWTRVLDEVHCMAPGPGRDLYAGRCAEDRVWHSPDGGDTWEAAGAVADGLQVVGLAWDARGQRLLAVAEGGLYESGDAGREWAFLAPVPATQRSRVRIGFHPRDRG